MKRVIGTAAVTRFLPFGEGPRQDVLTKALSGAKTVSILFIKVVAATAIVLGFSVLAERLGPRLAGILMGAPLGALISYYFIGQEAGPEFVAAGTPYAAAGMTGTLMFTYAYYRTSVWCTKWPPLWNAVAATTVGVGTYLAFSATIQDIPFTIPTALAVIVPAIFIGSFLFRKLGDVKVRNPARLSFKLLVIRASGAAFLVSIVSSLAVVLGPTLGGLLMAFPMTLLPTMLIVHLTYSAAHVHAMLSAFPVGLGSVIVYIVAVSETFPRYGVTWGSLSALAAAWAYLMVLPLGFKMVRRLKG